MEEAMKIFSIWMKEKNIKHSKKKMIVETCSGKGKTEIPCKKGAKKAKII